MLRLPPIDVISPKTVAEAVKLLAQDGARVIAGGTDILPNLKHHLDSPKLLVDITQVQDFPSTEKFHGAMCIASNATLTEIATNSEVLEFSPALAKAASVVASPSIRNGATIGGNIHLDTRCRYVNQTEFWRSAIGGCLKSEGDVCHVVKGGKNCVAAMSSDCVPVLVALDATIILESVRGERRVPIREYYNNDGTHHINKESDELMTAVHVPIKDNQTQRYVKWTVRKNIDFPLVSLALVFDHDGSQRVTSATIVASVLNAKPKMLKGTDKLIGLAIGSEALGEAVSALIGKQCKPLGNVPYDAAYRRRVLPVYGKRGVTSLATSE